MKVSVELEFQNGKIITQSENFIARLGYESKHPLGYENNDPSKRERIFLIPKNERAEASLTNISSSQHNNAKDYVFMGGKGRIAIRLLFNSANLSVLLRNKSRFAGLADIVSLKVLEAEMQARKGLYQDEIEEIEKK